MAALTLRSVKGSRLTNAEVDANFSALNADIAALSGGGGGGPLAIDISGNAATASAVPWSGITSKPTTISGFGITNAPTKTGSGASGTWAINITGDAATTSQLTFSRVRTDGVNRGSYGSISVSGSLGSYAGIDFTTSNATLMIGAAISGVYRNNSTWDWYFNAGVLTVGSVPWARLTSVPTTLAGFGITDAPTKTGSGASGTWAINITGAAASAATLTTARTIDISGVTATATSFSGSANISIPITAVPATLLTGSIAAARINSATDYDVGSGSTVGGFDIGYRDTPQNSRSAAYTFALTDRGKCMYHPSSDGTARTWTIPANSSVSFPVGTAIALDNEFGAGTINLAITTDTLVWDATGASGARSLAPGAFAVIRKVTSTKWRISGSGIS